MHFGYVCWPLPFTDTTAAVATIATTHFDDMKQYTYFHFGSTIFKIFGLAELIHQNAREKKGEWEKKNSPKIIFAYVILSYAFKNIKTSPKKIVYAHTRTEYKTVWYMIVCEMCAWPKPFCNATTTKNELVDEYAQSTGRTTHNINMQQQWQKQQSRGEKNTISR